MKFFGAGSRNTWTFALSPRIFACAVLLLAIPTVVMRIRSAPSPDGHVRERSSVEGPPVTLGLSDSVVLQAARQHWVLDETVKTELGGRAFRVNRTSPLRPAGDALEFVQSLLPASDAGDAVATFSIFLAVLDCRRALGGPPRASSDNGDVLRRMTECTALFETPSWMTRDWLTLAADQGSIEAMLNYPNDPAYVLGDNDAVAYQAPERVAEWRQRARGYLETASRAGSQDAMLELSSAYGAGVYVDKDACLQHAYALVAQRMYPIPGLDHLIGSYERELTPAQKVRSREIARDLYRTCCEGGN